MAQNYWLFSITPNMKGASDLWLVKESDIVMEIRDALIEGNNKHHDSLPQQVREELFCLTENGLDMTETIYNPQEHRIVRILKYTL